MSEDYKFQVTYNTPPPQQYAKGNMLNIRANTADELQSAIDDAKQRADLAPFFAFAYAMNPPVDLSSDGAESVNATEPTPEEAQAAIERNLGAGQEAASPAQIAVAARKSGKTVEELQGISVEQAKALAKGEQ